MASASDYVHLILDFGNTCDKYAVFQPDGIQVSHILEERLSTETLEHLLNDLKPTAAILSSTAAERPELRKQLMDLLPFVHLTHETPVPFQNAYATPETLGRDRIAAIAGVRNHVADGAALVVDTGTCVTYDLLDSSDVYHGGAIAPGIRLRLNAMHTFTARLPLVDWDASSTVKLIGDSTENSLLSGAVLGAAAEIDSIAARYAERFDNLHVLLTGGDALALQASLKSRIFAVPNLVAEGLNKILIHNVI